MNSIGQNEPGPGVRTAKRPTAITISLVVFAFAVCYFRLFVFPNVPVVPMGDQTGFATSGARIVAGQLPYRDFFEILPPGTALAYALLERWFGVCDWIPALVMSCLAAATVLLMTLAVSRFLRGIAVALPGLLFTGFILLRSTDATHHWFSTVAVLIAMLVLLDGTALPRIGAAGALCGVAACFTQTKGAAAVTGFIAYLVWKSWREDSTASECWRGCLLLSGAAFAVFAAANVYFIEAAGFGRWFYCLVVYPLRYYPAPAINNWRVLRYDFQWHQGLGSWIAFPFVYATVPLVYLIFLLVTNRKWIKAGDRSADQLLLIAMTGIAMFVAIAPSPSIKRLSTVSPPAMILLSWLLSRPGKMASVARVALGTLAFAVAVASAVHVQTHAVTYLNLPAGRTAFLERDVEEEYGWVMAHTRPGQFFFGMPPFYLPFRLQNPAAITGSDTSEYTRPEDVIALLRSLDQNPVPLIVLASESKYPLTVDRPSNHLGPFVTYLHAHYRLTKTFRNGDEVWERSSSPTENSPVGPGSDFRIKWLSDEDPVATVVNTTSGGRYQSVPPRSDGRHSDFRIEGWRRAKKAS